MNNNVFFVYKALNFSKTIDFEFVKMSWVRYQWDLKFFKTTWNKIRFVGGVISRENLNNKLIKITFLCIILTSDANSGRMFRLFTWIKTLWNSIIHMLIEIWVCPYFNLNAFFSSSLKTADRINTGIQTWSVIRYAACTQLKLES